MTDLENRVYEFLGRTKVRSTNEAGIVTLISSKLQIDKSVAQASFDSLREKHLIVRETSVEVSANTTSSQSFISYSIVPIKDHLPKLTRKPKKFKNKKQEEKTLRKQLTHKEYVDRQISDSRSKSKEYAKRFTPYRRPREERIALPWLNGKMQPVTPPKYRGAFQEKD